MGSPLSPVIANIYMEAFEEEALDKASKRPSMWIRYVDDTFVIWPHGRKELQTFHNHLNNLRDSIKFTMEEEENGSIPFLDVLVTRNNNHMTTSIHRKKTHTDRYLHYASYHHPRTKTGTISCLRRRAETLCPEKNIDREKEHLHNVFAANGYPERITDRCLVKKSKPPKPQEEETDGHEILCLPYI